MAPAQKAEKGGRGERLCAFPLECAAPARLRSRASLCVHLSLPFQTRSYSSYCATVARTYFVDPSDKQATVYRALSAAQAAAIAAIVDGAPFSAPRAAAVASLKAAGEEGLVERLAPSIGWSIGLEFEDHTLPLADDSASTIRSGMAFSVQIGAMEREKRRDGKVWSVKSKPEKMEKSGRPDQKSLREQRPGMPQLDRHSYSKARVRRKRPHFAPVRNRL